MTVEQVDYKQSEYIVGGQAKTTECDATVVGDGLMYYDHKEQ